MSDIDWSKAPEGFPIWIQDLTPNEDFDGSGWHRDDGDRYTDQDWGYRTKPEEGFYVVHMPPAPWTGTGLPPVGTVCEYLCGSGSWVEVEITAIARLGVCFVQQGRNYVALTAQFRPCRTPEQIAAEERDKAIAEAMKGMAGSGVHCSAEACRNIAASYVDAGYRKTEAP